MSHFEPPSKEEIKKRYGIANDDFDVLVSDTLPSAKTLKEEESMLEAAAEFFGVPTFLKKKGFWILAVIFLPYWGPKVRDEFRDCIVTTTAYYADVLTKKHIPLETPGFGQDALRFVITVPDHKGIIRNAVDLERGKFPEGSGIYPFSGRA